MSSDGEPRLEETVSYTEIPTDITTSPRGVAVAAADHGLPVRDPDRYRLDAEHARGGLGKIMRARDVELARPLAIKQLLRDRPNARARFWREARVTARLQHPSIVPVYDAGRWPSGEPFYAMKFVSGRSLRDAIESTQSLDERLGLLPHLIAVAEAIAYAHSERIVHRDLKPANVVLGEFGETMVVDWGLAKDLSDPEERVESEPSSVEDEALTAVGGVLGTPAYMPPEQARGEVVDERADVYALGAMLYHLLVGAPPHDARRGRDANAAAQPIAERVPGVPPELATIVEVAMHPESDRRYASAREIAAELTRFRNGQLVAAHNYPRRVLVGRWLRRHRAVALATALFVVVGVVGTTLFVREQQALRRVAEGERAQARARGNEATRNLRALLIQQGVQELSKGSAPRAAVYLNEAYRRGATGHGVRLRLAHAMAGVEALQRSLAHPHHVMDAVPSRDGSVVVTAGYDKLGRVWSTRTGVELSRLEGHTREIHAIAISRDGSRVVTGSLDKTARVWDARTGEHLHTLADHGAEIVVVAISPDGTRAVTGCIDGRARVWDLGSGKLLHTLEHSNEVWGLAFSLDGARIATASFDRTAKIWNVKTGKLERTLSGHHKAVTSVAWSRDRIVTGSQDGTARVWNAVTGAEIAVLRGHQDWVVGVAVSSTGARVATASYDGNGAVWDASSGKRLHRLAHDERVITAAFSPDDTRVVTAGYDRTVRLWSVDSGAQLASYYHEAEIISRARFDSSGTMVVSASYQAAKIWSTKSATPHRLTHDGKTHSAAYDHTGTRLATASGHRAQVWNTRTGAVLLGLQGHTGVVRSIAFSPDGQHIATGSYDHTARIWNAGTGALVHVLEGHGARVQQVAFSPDGRRLATASEDKSARVWSVDTGRLLANLDGHKGGLAAAKFSPDGKRLLTAGREEIARIWDIESRSVKLTLKAGTGFMMDADFSPDGSKVVLANTDHHAVIRDAHSGAQISRLSGHGGWVTSARFSPDGTQVITASRDKTLRLWRVADGAALATIEGHRGWLWLAIFRPDGRQIASVSQDRTARLWSAVPETRSAAAVATALEDRVGFVLRDGQMVLRHGAR